MVVFEVISLSIYLQNLVASFLSVDGEFDLWLKGGQFKVLRQVDESVHDVSTKFWIDIFRSKFADTATESRQARKVAYHHQLLKMQTKILKV